MSAKTIVRTVVLSLVGLLVLAMLGAYLYFSNLPPAGKVVFMSPGEPAVLVVDGTQRVELSAKSKRTLELPAGAHTVEIESPAKRTLEIDVLDRKTVVVPVVASQCYATYDVTQSAYEGSNLPPRFVRVQTHDAAFELPYATYLSLDDLPKQRSSAQSVQLIVTDTCETIAELTAEHTGGS